MENKKPELTHISVPAEKNILLQKALLNCNKNEELLTLWKVNNINALERLGFSDHGIVHFQIVANSALRIARLLDKHGVKLSIVDDYSLSKNHGELVIFMASIMHDLGMSVNRDGHEEYSIVLANPLLHTILDFLPVQEKIIIISETLHAIISHREGGEPLTKEAGIVRVADALDMTEGRGRIPYAKGIINIHSLSGAGINTVEISDGGDIPIVIKIRMNNSAGFFQVDELLKQKLKGSGIEKYVKVVALVESETEKSLLKEFILV